MYFTSIGMCWCVISTRCLVLLLSFWSNNKSKPYKLKPLTPLHCIIFVDAFVWPEKVFIRDFHQFDVLVFFSYAALTSKFIKLSLSDFYGLVNIFVLFLYFIMNRSENCTKSNHNKKQNEHS